MRDRCSHRLHALPPFAAPKYLFKAAYGSQDKTACEEICSHYANICIARLGRVHECVRGEI